MKNKWNHPDVVNLLVKKCTRNCTTDMHHKYTILKLRNVLSVGVAVEWMIANLCVLDSLTQLILLVVPSSGLWSRHCPQTKSDATRRLEFVVSFWPKMTRTLKYKRCDKNNTDSQFYWPDASSGTFN